MYTVVDSGPEFEEAHGERGTRTYNGGLGQPPEAESLVKGSGGITKWLFNVVMCH